jgi:Gpi18-like mannosyltransferase
MTIVGTVDKFWSEVRAYLSKADLALDRYYAWKAIKDVKTPILIFLITRLAIIICVYIGIIMFAQMRSTYVPGYYPENIFINAWSRWDTGYYVGIMKEGYIAKQNAAFFPMTSMLSWITHIVIPDPFLSVIITSNICFLFALIYIYKFIQLKYGDSELAERMALYYSIFPTAFFFIAGYTESTFLLFLILTFYHAEKKNWQLSALFGIFALLTRSTGAILALPVLLIYMGKINYDIRKIKNDIIPIFTMPLGLVIVMGILMAYGRPALDFIYASRDIWPRYTAMPWFDLMRAFDNIGSFTMASILIGQFPVKLFCALVLVCLFLILSVVSFYRIGIAYGTYSLLAMIFFLVNAGKEVILGSDLRYIVVIFPVFILFAMYGKNKYFNYAYISFSLLLLALFATIFAMGGWIS